MIMPQDAANVKQEMKTCFADDVISVIVSMMEFATEMEVRKALNAASFVITCGNLSEVVKCEDGVKTNDLQHNSRYVNKDFFREETNISRSHLVICELADRDIDNSVEPVHHVLAANNLMDIFQQFTGINTFSNTSLSLPPLQTLSLSATRNMVSCILISLRGNCKNLNNAIETIGPLSLHDVIISVVDIHKPLEGLLSLLQSVYDPIFRSKREVLLRSQIQDLATSIRSHCQALPEVDLKKFVHSDILELCRSYPSANVQQLLDILGPARCTEPNFLRHVLFTRNACRTLLEIKFEGREIANVRDEVAYWQAVLRWLEQVEKQLHSREWKLVHRLLSHRVETSYELEFKMHAQLVCDYLSHLQNVPFYKIDDVEITNYSALVEELFDAMVRPTRYPSLQSVRLLNSTVREMAKRFVELMGNNNVLCMNTPEEQLQCLREIIYVMQDLNQRYLYTMELFYAKSPHIQRATAKTTTSAVSLQHQQQEQQQQQQQPEQRYHYLVLLRARKLWKFVNEHFYYERTLRCIFRGGILEARRSSFFYTELKAAYESFIAAVAASRCLWDVSSTGNAELQQALTTYENRLAVIDERIALVVGTMLASAQEMSNNAHFAYTLADGATLVAPPQPQSPSFVALSPLHGVGGEVGGGLSLYRIYSRFRPLRREKIQTVVTGFQMALLEQLKHEVKEVRESYFDVERSHEAVRLSVARFGVTPAVAHMMWEQSIQKEIEAYLVRHDAIHEHGWHQLMHLRTIEHRWCLDESLAQFFDVKFDDLITKELIAWSEVHGTAYALAYLAVAHSKDMLVWSSDPYIHIAQQFVQENDPSAISYAKSRLLILRIGHGRRTEGREIRDVRNFCDTIAQRIQERVVRWCEDVRCSIATLDVCPTTMKLKGPLWNVVDLSVKGGNAVVTCTSSSGGAHGSNTFRINKNISNFVCDGESTRIVMPNISFDMVELLQDMHMLDSMRLLDNHGQLFADVRSFFCNNEKNFRIANCLTELIYAFLAALGGEDELMAHLATEEYTNVYQSFYDGVRLRWSDEDRVTQFTQEFSGRVYAFCAAASRVREITAGIENIISKLRFSHRLCKSQVVVARVGKMCTLVDKLFSQSANAGWWVSRLQPRLDAAILRQLEEHLRRWTREFLSMARDTRFINKGIETDEFGLSPLRVRMRVVLKEISLSTTAAACRNYWINVLTRCFSWIHTMPTLPRQKQEESDEKLLPQTQQQQQQQQYYFYQHQVLPLFSSTQTYDRLLERLDPVRLMEPLMAIEKTVRDAIQIETKWRRGQRLLNIELGVLQQRLGDNIEKWCSVLNKIRDMATGLMDFTQPCTLVGGVVIDAAEAQKELGRKLDSMTQHVYLRYCDVVEKLVDACYNRIMENRTAVESYNVIGDLVGAAKFLCDLPAIKTKMQDVAQQIISLGPAEEYLTRQGFLLPESWIYVKRLKAEYTAYCELVDRKVTALELRRPLLRDDVKKQEETLRSQVEDLEKSFDALASEAQKQGQENELYLKEISEHLQQRFSGVQEQTARLSEQKNRIIKLQNALGMSVMIEGNLDVIIARMDELRWVCSHVAKAYKKIFVLGQTPFFEMVPQHLHEELLAVEQEVRAFPDVICSHQAYINLLRHVQKRLSFHRLMQDLRSDAMTPLERAKQHWMTLKTQLQATWRLGELTVADIWYSDPEKNAKIYSGVLEFAQGELRLESQLSQITAFWDSFQFNTIVYRNKLLLIRSWDAIFEKIADDIDSFQGMRSSPFFLSQQVVATVADWENRLNMLRQLLEVLMTVQQRWVHLDSIFTNNADIRRQLPNDAIQFDLLSHEFMNLLPASAGFGAPEILKAQDFMQNKKLFATLERLEGQLSWVQRSLSTYLDLQRRRFPRMFFVGDDDLLEIIGNSSDPTVIEKYLPKMFTALARFTIDSAATNGLSSTSSFVNILGFLNAEGEKVMMVRPVTIKGRTLHEWLTDVETQMVVSLRQLLVSAVALLLSVGKVTPEWIQMFPLQVVCLAFQVWWVRLQEETFAAWREERRQDGKLRPSMAVAQMVTLLDQLALDVTSSNLTRAFRYAIEELINISVYQRDVSRVIEVKCVVSAEDFEWLRVLRLYLIDESGELHCRMADASFSHGFEYLGWYKRLVQTVLTDRCYLTMTQALHTRLGGSPNGPAGSGKTETVKALGAQLGRHVLVFNCDNTFDFDAMGRIFIGLCQVGAWGCFDEFNRLEERVLSAVSEQIQTIQEALCAQATTVTLDQQIVPLRDTVALFVTMNPGFAGRSNLPSNVKQLFRSMTMAAPDRETIAEVMLFARGFRTAETLSRKIVPLFNLCSEKLSKQAHYDFGLRALKSVLVTAGDFRRVSKRNFFSESGPNNVACFSDNTCNKEVEYKIILHSLIITINPRLVTEDVLLFYSLLHDFFPGCNFPDPAVATLRAAVKEVCRATHYDTTPAWIEKVFQLYHTRKMRHGIMLVGPSGSGKTSCWKTLLRAMTRLPVINDVDNNNGDDIDVDSGVAGDSQSNSNFKNGDDCDNKCVGVGVGGGGGKDNKQEYFCEPPEAHAYVIDPKAMTKTGLFGVFDGTTREWKDGVFTGILRSIINNEKSNERSYKQHWIVFDGDVDPLWVENFNSLLDDNKIYTLPNGERLSLPSSVRILFEVQDLRYATPATVSRCGMVWFSHDTVPITSLFSRNLAVFYRVPMIDSHGAKRVVSLTEGGEGLKTRACGSHFIVTRNVTECLEVQMETGAALLTEKEITANKTSHIGNSVVSSFNDLHGEIDVQIFRELYAQDVKARVNVNYYVMQLQTAMANVWAPAFVKGGLLEHAFELIHTNKYWKKGIMEYNNLQMLNSIQLFLVDGVWQMWKLCTKNKVSSFSTDILQKYAIKVLQYAVLWGLGALLDHDHRKQLAIDLFLASKLSFSFFLTDKLPDDLTLLDVEPNPETGEWCDVRKNVDAKSVVRADQLGLNNVIIQTVDTHRHEKILKMWINGGNAAILCGPPGSGKTMLVTFVLRSCAEYDVIFLNFSSGTTPKNVIRALEQYCSVQNNSYGLVMSPASGKKLLLFCDEINLPAKDQYGTQAVIQFLRQLIDLGGYYRNSDNAWVKVENVQVIGACNPPTDIGRMSISQRFLRLAPVLFVNFPTEESLYIIYTSYCRSILFFNLQMQQRYAEKLARAMVNTYTATQNRFNLWQKPHYVYSPRDLSRWTRAIYNGIMTWDDSQRCNLTVESLVSLSVHEGLRVFQDRLVEHEEREWTNTTINSCFFLHFGSEIPASFLSPERPVLLYSTILGCSYSESSREALRAHIEHKLKVFCEEEVNVKLVVYDGMVDHVTRINRVLQQPMSHMLLAGLSGVGKTIIARFVAWINNMTVFRLSVHRNYKLDDFEADLRDVLRRVGCKLERICFIFDDSNIMEPSFLEYMNALLASGEVPGLFEGDEWGKLMAELRESIAEQQLLNMSNKPQKFVQKAYNKEQHSLRSTLPNKIDSGTSSSNDNDLALNPAGCCSGTGITQQETLDTIVFSMYVDTTSEQELYRWFLSNVKRNLHVIFTINPTSGEFANRAVTSPALFNRCTIDWFGDWDYSTRYQIARQFTRDIDVMISFEDDLQQKKENEARDAVAEALCRIYDSTGEVNRVSRLQNAHQGTFITPHHFTDSLQHMLVIYKEKKGESKEQLTHLQSGIAKIDAAFEDVKKKRAKLCEHEAELTDSCVKAQNMLDCIVTNTEKTKLEKLDSERLRQQLREEEEKILADKDIVQRQLFEVEPALQEAEAGLNSIKPEYLREIRAYTTPPRMVKRVLEVVLILMGEVDVEEWDTVKHHIRREDFLASVKAFKPSSITEESLLTVRKLLDEEGFTYDAAMRASRMTGPLLQWVKAQTNYAEILASVQPLRNRIELLSVEHDAKRRHLEGIEAEIDKMHALLVKLKEEYQGMTENSARIKNEMSGVAARCKRAETLLRQLFDERERWETEMKGFHIETRTTVGDCIMAAASLAYFGYFDEHTRQSSLFSRWSRCLQRLQIPFCEKLRSVVEYLVTPQERLMWEKYGLPKDHLCVENAMILSRCQRYPLIIDPNGVASAFLLQKYATEKINTTSFSKPGYLKQLDMAVRFGYPILMQDAELFDPALTPLVNHEIHFVRGHALVRLGTQDVEVAAAFRLFFLTRDSHYQPSPGMAGQVCIVNFTVTQSSLQSQCCNRIMLHEHFELDARRTHILRAQGECRLRLRVLEQELLTSIASSEGGLLENDALALALENLKNKTMLLKDDIAESEISMQAIMAVEARYEPLAATLAKLYFAIRRFSQLHRLYHYSVTFIFRLLTDALEALPPRSMRILNSGSDEQHVEDAIRLRQLTRQLFTLAYRRLRRGMFSQDHLVLAIVLGRLRSGISDDVGRQITLEEWCFFEDALLHSPTKNVTSNDYSNTNSNILVAGGGGVSNVIPTILRECGVCLPSCEADLAALLQRPLFSAVWASLMNPQDAAAWRLYFTSAAPYLEVMPAFNTLKNIDDTNYQGGNFTGSTEHTRSAFIASILLFYTRRDVFSRAVYEFLRRFFDFEQGSKTEDQNGNEDVHFFAFTGAPDLMAVQKELSEDTPLILVSNSCSDPTIVCEELARSLDVRLNVAVMGSFTGLELAEHYLTNAMAEGTWVLLKNIHLARTYADTVEKRLHRERSEGRLNPAFRLIISIEVTACSVTANNHVGVSSNDNNYYKNNNNYSEKSCDRNDESLAEISSSFIETSVMLIFEPPPGMKSSLLQTVGSLTPSSIHGKQPADVQRVYLAAAWLHAVVMERLLYIPMGWSRHYEFNDTEFWRILQAIDSWIGSCKKPNSEGGNDIIDRNSIPWAALQTIVGTTLYGGKISNEFDQLLVDFFCSQFLSDAVFKDDYLFAPGIPDTEPDACLKCSSIHSLHDVQTWVYALQDAETPLWARLPASVSCVISAQHATTTLERLATVRFVEENDDYDSTKNQESDMSDAQQELFKSVGETQWGRRILCFSNCWCAMLQDLTGATAASITNEGGSGVVLKEIGDSDPTVMAIQREYIFALECLGEIIDELRALKEVCTGARCPTATQCTLAAYFLKDQVPQRWVTYYQTYPTTAEEWLKDFKCRVEHVKSLYDAVGKKTLENTCISLGLLFWPGAFLTATKQQAARRQGLSLEHLKLQLKLIPEDSTLISVATSVSSDNCVCWKIIGLALYSARVQSDCGVCEVLHASSKTSLTRVAALIYWEPITTRAVANDTTLPVSGSSLLMRLASQNAADKYIATPFYLNSRRDVMLDVVDVAADPVKAPMRVWYERGVCLVAWS